MFSTFPEMTRPVMTEVVLPEVKFPSCVTYVRQFLPLPKIRTPADIEPNAPCEKGAALLLDYNEPHIAYITKVSNSELCLREGNFKKGKETFRCISISDPHIRGCWFPN